MDFGIKVLLAYLLGSVVGSLVVGRLKGGVDIRKMGSGNAGATNAIRTQGAAFGITVIIIDIAKGWLAAGWLPGVVLPGVSPSPGDQREWLTAACAFAAIIGHCFPVWHGFRGGKGVATLIGAFAGFDAILLLPMFATWLALPIYLMIRDGAVFTAELCFAIACAALVVFTHRGNLRRMRAGEEPRARKLWLFGRGNT
jgi:glycerol-3-phosphate acyltransferase PlsY